MIIETVDSKQVILKDTFSKCIICGTNSSEIKRLYPSRQGGAYYLDKFNNFLKDKHGITIKEYCIKYLKVSWPLCPASGKEVGFSLNGIGLIFSSCKYVTKETSKKFNDACNKFSEERKGRGNPMFGKKAWNKGLSIEDPRVNKMIDNFRGKPLSTEHKEKLKNARARSELKARHITSHSKESKLKMAEATAKGWAEGRFNKTTSIHIKVRDFLETLELTEWVEEEVQVKYFSMDFAFPSVKIAIECQGTFFHVDPRVYPNGPICKIQRRNYGRDKAKRKICCEQEGWVIIEIWETEINDGSFKEYLKCKLQELNLLKK